MGFHSRFTSPELQKAQKAVFNDWNWTRYLVLPDIHIPQHDRKAVELVLNYARHERDNERPFQGFIQIGDFMNFKQLSKHSEFDKLSLEGARIRKDADAANAFLDELQEIIPPENPSFIIEGNHDYRIKRYIKENPLLADLGLSVPELLKLDIRGITWVPNWSEGKVLTIGNATFVHGSIIRKHHAAGMMDKFQTNIFYGHTHDIQQFSQTTAGESKIRVAQALGNLQDPEDYWEQYNGNRWQLAFADFTFFAKGGFSYTVHQIHDYKTVIAGEVFTKDGKLG